MSNDYIAYSKNTGLYILIPSFLSILMNVIFIIHFIVKLYSNNSKNKMSSLEKLLLPLTILESLISLLWFLSGVLFERENKIDNNLEQCKILGLFQTFCYISDWLLVGFSISHLKNMILNPINYILKSGKKLRFYLIISIGTALVFSITCYFMDIVGKSPMLTCFLSLDFYFDDNINNTDKIVRLIVTGLICFFPVVNLIFGIIQMIIVYISDFYKKDKENKKIFNDHSLYLFIYFIMTFFLTSLYVAEFINGGKIDKNISLEYYFFVISIMICTTPLIVGVIRLYQTKIA